MSVASIFKVPPSPLSLALSPPSFSSFLQPSFFFQRKASCCCCYCCSEEEEEEHSCRRGSPSLPSSSMVTSAGGKEEEEEAKAKRALSMPSFLFLSLATTAVSVCVCVCSMCASVCPSSGESFLTTSFSSSFSSCSLARIENASFCRSLPENVCVTPCMERSPLRGVKMP